MYKPYKVLSVTCQVYAFNEIEELVKSHSVCRYNLISHDESLRDITKVHNVLGR